jgi:AcrR family transcriptional regulator
LLGAAQEVFVAQGYHAAAMDEIAERAGVSKPVLYQHFPGKMELYLALLEQHTDDLVNTVQSALASTEDNKHRVAATFKAFFQYVTSEGEAYRLLFESDLRNVPAVRARLEETLSKCADAVSQVIQADTDIPSEDAHLLGMGLVGMAETSARYWLGHRGEIPQATAEDMMARLAWRGISGWENVRRPQDGTA